MSSKLSKYAIEAKSLHKTFVRRRSLIKSIIRPFKQPETTEALRGIDLQVRHGELMGLLGPNGAGKTTLIKILCSLVLPDSGSAVVGGIDTRHENRVKPLFGLVTSDERSFYWRLSARDNLRFFARLYNVPSPQIEQRIAQLLDRVDLNGDADRQFATFSSGKKQRLAIARALLHDPPILFMDEPTRSLDPESSLSVRDFINGELKQRDGKTILLASHNLREIEVLADRVTILTYGRVFRTATVAEVMRWGIQEERFELDLSTRIDAIPGLFRIVSDRQTGDLWRVTIAVEQGIALGSVLKALLASGVVLYSCDRIKSSFEETLTHLLISRSHDS